ASPSSRVGAMLSPSTCMMRSCAGLAPSRRAIRLPAPVTCGCLASTGCSAATAPTRLDVRRLMNGEQAILLATDPPYPVDHDGTNHPTGNKDWSKSYGVTWDDSSQGAELYDGFIAAAKAEAITEDAAWVR